jgi:hypothetical protein
VRAAASSRSRASLADERNAVELDRPAEADLEGRRLARLERPRWRAVVVDAEQDEAGFDAQDVERVEPRRLDAVGLPASTSASQRASARSFSTQTS